MRLLLLALAVMLICAGCAAAEMAEGTDAPDEGWTFPLSREILLDEQDFLVLANTESRLAEDYAPKDLVSIKVRKSKDETMKMRKAVSEALDAMFKDALSGENVKLYAHSCYRSFATQKSMYNSRLARMGYDDKLVQQPGCSDHQTGLGIDVIGASWLGKERLNEGIAATKEGAWLLEHCTDYGFIIRYPKEAEAITGIKYEPWHLRYVGVEAAAYITENNLTLEEFTIVRENSLSRAEAAEDTDTRTFFLTEPQIVVTHDGFEDLN